MPAIGRLFVAQTLRFLTAFTTLLPQFAHAEFIGILPNVSLRFSNDGSPDVGFADGYITHLFKDTTRFPTFLDVVQKNVSVESTDQPTIFRLTFEKPLILKLTDGESVTQRPLRFVDADFGKYAEPLRVVLSLRPDSLVMIGKSPLEQIWNYQAELQRQGLEHLALHDINIVPEFFQLESLSLSGILLKNFHNLSAKASLEVARVELRRVNSPEGHLDSARTSVSIDHIAGATSINDIHTRALLASTSDARNLRNYHFHQLLKKALPDGGLLKGRKGKIIQFPVNPKSIDCTNVLSTPES